MTLPRSWSSVLVVRCASRSAAVTCWASSLLAELRRDRSGSSFFSLRASGVAASVEVDDVGSIALPPGM